MNIRTVKISETPSYRKHTGRWALLWSQVKDLPVGKDVAIEVSDVDNGDVERIRTAMLSYRRRAKPSWKLRTHTSSEKPNTIWLWKE